MVVVVVFFSMVIFLIFVGFSLVIDDCCILEILFNIFDWGIFVFFNGILFNIYNGFWVLFNDEVLWICIFVGVFGVLEVEVMERLVICLVSVWLIFFIVLMVLFEMFSFLIVVVNLWCFIVW